MLTGTIIATVNREPKTGTGKNGKEYTMLPLHRKVKFGDRVFDKYYTATFGWGQAVKDAARCQVGDVVAVAFDDVQADTYESQGKTKAGIKLNGTSCIAVTAETAQANSGSGERRSSPIPGRPTDEQMANQVNRDGSGAGSDDVPFAAFYDCAC